MSQRTQVAHLAAHVPFGYTHDEHQTPGFKDPLTYEQYFQEKTGSHRIASDYISHLNQLLKYIDQINKTFVDKPQPNGKPYFKDFSYITDVVQIAMEIGTTEITVNVIQVRPCFVGHKLFQIIMLQLLHTAGMVHKTLNIETCYPKTLNIMNHFFGKHEGLMRVQFSETFYKYPDCVFPHPDTMLTVTPEQLHIADYVNISSEGIVSLVPSAFPSAEELNNIRYVDAFYAARHNVNSYL